MKLGCELTDDHIQHVIKLMFQSLGHAGHMQVKVITCIAMAECD